MMAEPDVQRRLAEIGFEAKWTEPRIFKEELAADIALWAKLTKEAGIEPQ
jgi:tripartite-type tricarboxylate transporter receptor subunit TctC